MPRSRRLARPRAITLALLAVAAAAFPLGVAAGHVFSDVPDSSPYHGDVTALAAAGITTGCGGGKYCPKDPVTREQMAAFMNRLGALGPGKVPVVNADRLDGLDASAFAAAAHDHDADYLASDGTAADADLLDGHDASSFAGGLTGQRMGNEIALTSDPTTVATLTLPVSPVHSTFLVVFTAQVVSASGPVHCSLLRDDDAVLMTRWAGGYSPYGSYGEVTLSYPVWVGDTAGVHVDCQKGDPSATIAAVQGRELQALALGSGS